MEYPVEILPGEGLKLIDKDPNYYIIRYTDSKDIWNIQLDSKQLKDSAICSPKTNMMDLSTSLFGIFEIPHTKIKINNQSYNEYCPPNTIVDIPKYPDDFEKIDERGYWFLLIEQIDGLKVNYRYGDETLEATCHVLHTPMKWNYWHFSIRWYLDSHKKYWHELADSEHKKKWSRDKLSSETRSFLKIKIKDIQLNKINIPEELYKSIVEQ